MKLVYMRVSCRELAKLLARGMPIEGQDYSDKVESYITSIEAMPVELQSALSAAYIFSKKAPHEERQDLFQELVTEVLEALSGKSIPSEEMERFCYAVAKRKWIHFIQKENRHKRMFNGGFLSLNRKSSHPLKGGISEEIEFQDLIAGEAEFERKLNSDLDSQALLDTLPAKVKELVTKRLESQTLSKPERNQLNYYCRENGEKIREALTV